MTSPNQAYRIHRLELGPMDNFIYLIEDQNSRRCAVVDPAWNPERIIAHAREHGLTISDILLTHSHFDHINGVEKLLADSDAQIHLLKAEAKFWGGYPPGNITLHHGGDTIKLGDTSIDILHTPGHTPGSACYRLGNDLLTGDTLFVFGCGRCDLPGGDPNVMYDTLRRLKQELPPQTLIHPGHNYAEKATSSMAEQIEGNPFLHFDKREEFVQYRQHDHDRLRQTPYQPITRRCCRR